jgi:hypothetical protein
MHPIYRKRCERDGLKLKSMWLGEADLEPDSGSLAVIEQPSSIVTRSLPRTATASRKIPKRVSPVEA